MVKKTGKQMVHHLILDDFGGMWHVILMPMIADGGKEKSLPSGNLT